MNETSSISDYKKQVARIFNRVANCYDQAAVVEKEIGYRLFERLEIIRISPTRILELGGGTGYFARKLAKQYDAELLHYDLSENMLRHAKPFNNIMTLCGDAEHLPFRNNSIDFVFANCVFSWCPNLKQLFGEIQRILKPNGLLLFSTFGPDTFIELQESCHALGNIRPISAFLDMHIIGDALLQANLDDPVVDMETLTLTYSTVSNLLHDLQQTGFSGHYENCLSLNALETIDSITLSYERFRNKQGNLPVTFEVIYGHAWGAGKKRMAYNLEEDIYPITEIGRFLDTTL